VYGARAAAAAREGEDGVGGGEGGGCRDDPDGLVAADFGRDCGMVDAKVCVS
jgi:hypothetical protein